MSCTFFPRAEKKRPRVKSGRDIWKSGREETFGRDDVFISLLYPLPISTHFRQLLFLLSSSSSSFSSSILIRLVLVSFPALFFLHIFRFVSYRFSHFYFPYSPPPFLTESRREDEIKQDEGKPGWKKKRKNRDLFTFFFTITIFFGFVPAFCYTIVPVGEMHFYTSSLEIEK